MRVVDLDRDMRDVIPTGTTRDSEYLFARMTKATLDCALPDTGRRVLDVASGFGQDAIALASRGAWSVGAEPSFRMSALARMLAQKATGPEPLWIRSWGDALPFADGSFDGVICKGALDHFDRPAQAIGEMARVTQPNGRVVLAIANFDSLSCRAARGMDWIRERWLDRPIPRGRRHYDVPSDHFTRYELDLMREQASAFLHLEVVEGISMAWGMPVWTRSVDKLPQPVAQATLETLDRLAKLFPSLSDVIVLAGRPRRFRNESTISP
jgi:SAM-dependent methyltransferase